MKPKDSWRLQGAVTVSVALHMLVLLLPNQRTDGYAEPGLSVSFKASSDQLQASSAPVALSSDESKTESMQLFQSEPTAGASLGSAEKLIHSQPEPSLPPVIYYTIDRLTRRPTIEIPPELDSPELEAVGGTGVVVLQLWISEQGHVVDATVERSELAKLFGAHTIKALQNARFHPAEIDGVAVRSLIHIEVSYEVSGAR